MAEIVGGGTPSTAISSYWDGDIDWYAPAEIAGQIYVSNSQRISSEQNRADFLTRILANESKRLDLFILL